MNNYKMVIPIVVGIVIVMIVIVGMINQGSNKVEIEDILENELKPTEEITPEIQEKIDDIEKNKLENKYSPVDREWITSGPFQIDRSEYRLGEKIFLRIGGLNSDEKGQVAFLRPLNSTHYSVYWTIPFDGSKKAAFNYYLQPQLSKNLGYCTSEDFIGEWRVVFRGTNYSNLEFKITEKILPGDEEDYQPVC